MFPYGIRNVSLFNDVCMACSCLNTPTLNSPHELSVSFCYCIEKSKVEIFKKTGTEIGKKAAERSGGLFSADDWHCSRYILSLLVY